MNRKPVSEDSYLRGLVNSAIAPLKGKRYTVAMVTQVAKELEQAVVAASTAILPTYKDGIRLLRKQLVRRALTFSVKQGNIGDGTMFVERVSTGENGTVVLHGLFIFPEDKPKELASCAIPHSCSFRADTACVRDGALHATCSESSNYCVMPILDKDAYVGAIQNALTAVKAIKFRLDSLL